MMGVLLALLVAACVFCVSFVGVGLWVIYTHFTTADIPAGISHPKKLRFIHCIFLLLVTWVSVMFLLSPVVRVKERVGKHTRSF